MGKLTATDFVVIDDEVMSNRICEIVISRIFPESDLQTFTDSVVVCCDSVVVCLPLHVVPKQLVECRSSRGKRNDPVWLFVFRLRHHVQPIRQEAVLPENKS